MAEERIVEFTTTISFKLILTDELTPRAVLAEFDELVARKRALLTNNDEVKRRLALLRNRAPEGTCVIDIWKSPIKPVKKE